MTKEKTQTQIELMAALSLAIIAIGLQVHNMWPGIPFHIDQQILIGGAIALGWAFHKFGKMR